jgi:hypothetical protein
VEPDHRVEVRTNVRSVTWTYYRETVDVCLQYILGTRPICDELIYVPSLVFTRSSQAFRVICRSVLSSHRIDRAHRAKNSYALKLVLLWVRPGREQRAMGPLVGGEQALQQAGVLEVHHRGRRRTEMAEV